jgi:MFS family permease
MSIVGRIVGGASGVYFGTWNCFTIFVFATAISCAVLWLWAGTVQALLAFAIVFGFFGGCFISLIPTVIALVCGVHDLASKMGVVYFFMAISHWAGPPLAGALKQGHILFGSSESVFPAGGYTWMIIYGAGTMFISGVFAVYMRVVAARKSKESKVH